MLIHSAKSDQPSNNLIFSQIRDEITSIISTLCANSASMPSAQPGQVLLFLENLAKTIMETHSSLSEWCSAWFCDLFKILKPVDDKAATSSRWLLSLSLMGYIDGQLTEDPFSLLLDSVLPAQELKWSRSMSLGMAKCWHAPSKEASWCKASPSIQMAFLVGPVAGLISESSASMLTVLVQFSTIVTGQVPLSTESCLQLFKIIFSNDDQALDPLRNCFLDAVILKADYCILSDIVLGLDSYGKPIPPGAISKLINLTLDILWTSESIPHLGDALIVSLSKLPIEDRVQKVNNEIWSRILKKMADKGTPADAYLLLAFSSRCLPKDGRSEFARTWMSAMLLIFAKVCQNISNQASSYDSPRFLQVNNGLYPLNLLPGNGLDSLLVELQLGFRLRFQTELIEDERQQLACLLTVLRVWMMGIGEPYLLTDISNTRNLVLPADGEETSDQFGSTLITAVNSMYVELTCMYKLEDWVALLSNHPVSKLLNCLVPFYLVGLI